MNWEKKQAALKDIYQRFEKAAEPYKREAVCRLGCTYCCTDVGNVDINTLEGLIIRQELQRMPRTQRRTLEKRLADNRKKKRNRDITRCAFLSQKGACLIYDVRPFSCRQLYSLRPCDGRGPTVHRQAVALSKKTVREMQQLDDTGYSGHISFVLQLLDKESFRQVYLNGGFDPPRIMSFGKAHGIVINRFVT